MQQVPQMYHQQFWVGRHFRGGVKQKKQAISPDDLEQICYSPTGINYAIQNQNEVRNSLNL
jgi:hypothetical protein